VAFRAHRCAATSASSRIARSTVADAFGAALLVVPCILLLVLVWPAVGNGRHSTDLPRGPLEAQGNEMVDGTHIPLPWAVAYLTTHYDRRILDWLASQPDGADASKARRLTTKYRAKFA
jgi:hypothetical protein